MPPATQHERPLRACACCKLPAPLVSVQFGAIDGVHVVFGLCSRCERANARLPAGTRQKRLNAAGALAARDTSGRFYVARYSDPGAAQLTAHLLGNPATAHDTAAALGWI